MNFFLKNGLYGQKVGELGE